jgi:succinate dehydrogenase hydrophobic anchor subunit
VLEALALWPGAVWLRQSSTAYLFVNAAHILGIGLVLGAILPLDLRLMGLFRQVPLPILAPFLSRMAASGVALAMLTGVWLFSVRPGHYLENAAFLAKLALLMLALVNIGLQHGVTGYRHLSAGGEAPLPVRLAAGTSAILWIGALVAGRWIGFL